MIFVLIHFYLLVLFLSFLSCASLFLINWCMHSCDRKHTLFLSINGSSLKKTLCINFCLFSTFLLSFFKNWSLLLLLTIFKYNIHLGVFFFLKMNILSPIMQYSVLSFRNSDGFGCRHTFIYHNFGYSYIF